MRSLILLLLVTSLSLAASAQTVSLVSLEQLENRLSRGKDTTFVVNFWATWCAPCLKELPRFEQLQAEFGGEKLKVLLVSVDYPSKLKSAVVPMARRLKLKNELLLLNEKKQKGYSHLIAPGWSGALPATLMVNPARGKREFFEKELSYPELVRIYQSI